MALCQLFIQPETAYLSVSELGETGTVQFRDVSSIASRILYKIIFYFLKYNLIVDHRGSVHRRPILIDFFVAEWRSELFSTKIR